jgi:hypothetical protein
VDESLHPKLLELKWSVDQYKDILIPCLGGLHIGTSVASLAAIWTNLTFVSCG